MAEIPHTVHVDIRPIVAGIAKPGDTVLIGFDHTLDEAELEAVYEAFRDFTNTTGIHVAVVERATSMIVARPGDDDLEKEFPDEDAG